MAWWRTFIPGDQGTRIPIACLPRAVSITTSPRFRKLQMDVSEGLE